MLIKNANSLKNRTDENVKGLLTTKLRCIDQNFFLQNKKLGELLLDAELLNEGVILRLTFLFKILEVCTTIGNHFEQSATRVMILLVIFKMDRKLVDLLA